MVLFVLELCCGLFGCTVLALVVVKTTPPQPQLLEQGKPGVHVPAQRAEGGDARSSNSSQVHLTGNANDQSAISLDLGPSVGAPPPPPPPPPPGN